MQLRPRGSQRGVTLVEIVIGLAIASALLSMGVVGFRDVIQNSRIRAVAESIQGGLQLARATAVQTNGPMRFELVTATDNTCAASTTASNWVVSGSSPDGLCASQAGVNPPGIVQIYAASESAGNVVVATNMVAATGGNQFLVFNGLGRLNPALVNAVNIDFSYPPGGDCAAMGGNMRCLRVTVSIDGRIRICDPALPNTDPGAC